MDYYLDNADNNNPFAQNFDPQGHLTSWGHHQIFNVTLFNIYILGTIVETLQQIVFRYGGNILKFIKTQQLQTFILILDLLMVYLSMTYALTLARVIQMNPTTLLKLTMMWASIAPIIFGRVLITLIPLIPKLGPMLQTFQAMLGEIGIFAIPWFFVTSGFAVSLQVIFRPLNLPGFSNWIDIMNILFRSFADKFDWALLDDIDHLNLPWLSDDIARTYKLYGTLIMTIYTIISTIILGNLLIAIITNRYRPEQSKALFNLNFADAADTHRWMVRENLLSSPFNLVPILFFWLPYATRRKVHHREWTKWGVFPLDGFAVATPSHLTLPSGRNEIPHLIYLLVLHPLILAAMMVMYFIQLPYCVYFFAAFGHKKILAQLEDLRRKSFNSHGKGSLAATAGSGVGGLPLKLFGTTQIQPQSLQSVDAELALLREDSQKDQNDEKAAVDSGSLLMIMRAMGRVIQKILSFIIFLGLGLLFYTFVIGGLLVVFFPLLTYFLCIAWSMYHILAGGVFSFLSFLARATRFFSTQKSQVRPLSPPSVVESTCFAGKNVSERLRMDHEKKIRNEAILTKGELLACISDTFSEECVFAMERGFKGDEEAKRWAQALKGGDESGSGSSTPMASLSSASLQYSAARKMSQSEGTGNLNGQTKSPVDRLSRLSRTVTARAPPQSIQQGIDQE